MRGRSVPLLPALGAMLVLLALVAAACKIERRIEVEVTPGTVPEEIRGARWQSFPVRYCVFADDSGFVPPERFGELVNEAFRRWGAEVISDGACDAAERGNDRNEIGWGTAEAVTAQGPHAGVFQAGFTRQLFRSCPGGCEGGAESRIVEADVLIEPSPHEQFTSEECLFATLLHETGHFLGVPHLESPAVMAPAASTCPQQLTEADRAALGELYGEPPASNS